MDLFDDDTAPRRLQMQGADVVYHRAFNMGMTPDDALEGLREGIPWIQQDTGWGPEPRLTSWHADGGISYTYSGRTMTALPLTPLLDEIRSAVETASGARYNSVLLNQYRSGQDSIGFHADDEPGVAPTIASVSLGAERVFELRPNRRGGGVRPVRIALAHGSLLVMSGDTQRNWKHGIRKTDETGMRINLTFRWTDRT